MHFPSTSIELEAYRIMSQYNKWEEKYVEGENHLQTRPAFPV